MPGDNEKRIKKGFNMNSAGKHSRKAPSNKNIPNFTRENKQQGTAAIIHSPSYFWRLSEEQSQTMSDHLPQQHFHQWVTFWTPPHLNSCLPLAGAAACPKGSSGFVTNMPFLRAEARSHSTCLLLWKQHACCTSKDMPRQQLRVFSLAGTTQLSLLLLHLVHHQVSTLDVFFFLFNPSQLPWAFAFLDHFHSCQRQHLRPAQPPSAQEGETLIFSTDLITEVLFTRLKRNTPTDNVPTAQQLGTLGKK